MYKDLLVPIRSTSADDGALSVTLQLAGHTQAHLSVLEVVNLPLPATPWGMAPEIGMTDVYQPWARRARAMGWS